ncbi:MAG: hypothetical protein V3S06_02690 [candidate division Zixibacteria bacterium]
MKIAVFSLLVLVATCFSPVYGLDTVGFDPLAESDTVFLFNVLTCDEWIDGKPAVLFRSVGYPDSKQLNFTVGYHYLYSVKYNGMKLETQFVMAESLYSKSIIAGDFDADGNVEIMGMSSLYYGDGTEIMTMQYKAGSWSTYKEIIPYYIERLIRVDLYDSPGDDFIFLFNALDLSQADSTNAEVESPPLGLIYGNWDGQHLNLSVDSTIHNAIESMGSIYGETTFVYIYEQLEDSTIVTLDGPLPIGALVKYRFNRELSKLERLYYVESPVLTNDIVSEASSSLYASDSLIQLFGNKLMQWYIDNGDSLTISLFQWTPFPCYDPVLIDIDADGEKELICTEPIVTGIPVQVPNCVLKAYKLLE